MSRNIIAANACLILLFAGGTLAQADDRNNVRRPLGVYAKADIETAANAYITAYGKANPGAPPLTLMSPQVHAAVAQLYAGLLTDRAISGISVGEHWDNIQLSDPLCVFNHTCLASPDGYDWSYLDEAFEQANLAHKSVNLIITPGVNSPSWLLSKIPSCDGLFPAPGSAPPDCGKVTFSVYPQQQQRGDSNVFPLPWSGLYQLAWWDFLVHLNARYNNNPAFLSIAVAGPVGASDELILPTNSNQSFQQPGVHADDAWSALINHSFPNIASYQNTDQAFIDQWDLAIDAYERIFTGITLVLAVDAGQDFPEFALQNPTLTVHHDNTLWAEDCVNSAPNAPPDNQPRSCEAKTEILSYFRTLSGGNGKATWDGGMTATSPTLPGDIGVPGVKLLTSLSPSFSGGAEFDHPVSQGQNMQAEGCNMPDGDCPGLTAEEGAYNVLSVFFSGTPAYTYYGAMPGSAPIQYLDVDYTDVQYAQSNPCPTLPSTVPGTPSLQDLLNRASRDIFAMAGQPQSLPPTTCPRH